MEKTLMRITKAPGTLLLVTLGLFAQSVFASEAPLVLKRNMLTMDAAEAIGRETIKACRKEGVNVAVTVVDRAGQTMVVMRDTLAMALTLDISQQKAYSALSFNSRTRDLDGRFKGPGSIAKVNGVITSAGGVPITAGGNILGGVGVSGAPSGDTDEKCAMAGINAISTELEMAQ